MLKLMLLFLAILQVSCGGYVPTEQEERDRTELTQWVLDRLENIHAVPDIILRPEKGDKYGGVIVLGNYKQKFITSRIDYVSIYSANDVCIFLQLKFQYDLNLKPVLSNESCIQAKEKAHQDRQYGFYNSRDTEDSLFQYHVYDLDMPIDFQEKKYKTAITMHIKRSFPMNDSDECSPKRANFKCSDAGWYQKIEM